MSKLFLRDENNITLSLYMKKPIHISSLILLALTLGLWSCNSANSEEGFVKLFNEKDWEGWHLKIKSGDSEMALKVYAIEDGIIHVFNDEFPDTITLNTGENDTHGLFYTNQKYSKYVLRFEYKWGTKIANNFNTYQYDAGCYYHVIDDKIWPTGIEYQIRYDHTKDKNHTGDFWASGTKFQWYAGEDSLSFLQPANGGTPQPIRGGEHLALATASHHALDNQWNKCEVIAMGDQYTIHKLNGQIVNMAKNLSVSEGIIGFQSETAEIFYRNIEIKEYEEIPPMEEFLKNQ